MSFSDDIKKWTEKTEKAATFVFRGTALDIFSKVILRTPVDTGRLRGNWQCTSNSLASGEINGTGQQSLSKVKTTTGKAKLTDTLYLVNNLPYAGVIEDGSSDQAPQGMIKVTVLEYQNIVKENVRRNK